MSARFHQEERVEHDGFRKGDGQDGLDQNLRGCAGIPAHRGGSRHADQTHADGCSHRGQADVDIATQKISSAKIPDRR